MPDKTLSEMSWQDYREFLKQNARKQQMPLNGTFELTPLCNFDCKMCYVHLTSEKMREMGRLHTAEEWIELGRQARQAGVLTLLLTGGEVLTRPDFCEIYEALSEMGFVISVFSNGYLVSDRVLAVLKRRPPVKFRITLYGASSETYKKVTGCPDGYTRVMDNIDRLRNAGVPVMLAFTGIEDNIDDLEPLKKLVDEMDLSLEYSTAIVKPVRGADRKVDTLRVKDREDRLNLEKKSIPYREVSVNDSPFSICGSNRCGFWTTWNGNMSVCSFISSVQTHPFEQGFSAAWQELCTRLNSVKRPSACFSCAYASYCVSCPGTREAETGDMEQICPRYCERAKDIYMQARVSAKF